MPEDEPCEEALQELYTFLDGELTDDRRAAIQQHLDDCPPCYEQYDFEAELRLIVAAKCKDTVPDSLRDRIAHALGNEAPPSEPAI
jgi:mycothiol system anti-sigma-R factor